ncbi:kinetochore-associated protein KNL-2 homolog isoform X1 [Fagus crenata]
MGSSSGSSETNGGSSYYFQETVCLHDWWLIKAEKDFQGKRLAVAGSTSREKEAVQVFSSAPIIKRYDYSTVVAADGIRVVIGGLFNKLRSQDNGFPSTVVRHFVLGFPANWDEYAAISGIITDSGFSNQSVDEGKSDAKEGMGKKKKKTKRNLILDFHVSTRTREGKKKKSIAASESFGRSRSGRLLVPTLEFWRNQVPVYDVDRDIIGIMNGLPEIVSSEGVGADQKIKKEGVGGVRSKPQKRLRL